MVCDCEWATVAMSEDSVTASADRNELSERGTEPLDGCSRSRSCVCVFMFLTKMIPTSLREIRGGSVAALQQRDRKLN